MSHDTAPLLGRSWIRARFGLKWLDSLLSGENGVLKVAVNESNSKVPEPIQKIIDKYSDSFFKPGLGLLKDFKADFDLQPNCKPKFCKPRIVPFAIQQSVSDTLDGMEREGQLQKVNFSHWGTPVVLVRKSDQSIRICGDYKMTLNPQLLVLQYPMPKPEELFHSLQGGKFFTKLDLSQAYK